MVFKKDFKRDRFTKLNEPLSPELTDEDLNSKEAREKLNPFKHHLEDEYLPKEKQVWVEVMSELWTDGYDSQVNSQVASLMQEWVKNKNTAYIDDVLLLICQNKVPFTPVLKKYVSESILNRVEHRDSCSFDKPIRRGQKEKLMSWMASFMAAGLTLKDASEKAILFGQKNKFSKLPMASTLQKDFSHYKLVEELRAIQDSDEVLKLATSLGELPENLRGERR
ncbi:hypothetical protein ACE012_12215 [Shewanella xiamenensis]|uniref:hypothetical protein n=1 Tax=Shewanella xiamenensis TaxID=332186 RepID=UPI0035B7F8BD